LLIQHHTVIFEEAWFLKVKYGMPRPFVPGSTFSCVMVETGQISSQAMQAMSQGRLTAIVSKSLMKPASCGQIATHAPQLMQAFQPI
jgi:hypothetical protein